MYLNITRIVDKAAFRRTFKTLLSLHHRFFTQVTTELVDYINLTLKSDNQNQAKLPFTERNTHFLRATHLILDAYYRMYQMSLSLKAQIVIVLCSSPGRVT